MAFIEVPDDGGELYEADRREQGYVANLTRAFAHRPELYAAWRQLITSIRSTMDPRRYELVTLAAARELRSSYCMLAHGKVLAEQFYDAGQVRAIATGGGPLDDVDRGVMDLAAKVVRDATGVTRADIERLHALGLADEEILDVVAAASARCFFSKTLDALGVEPDPEFWELDASLRDELVVGRPIAARP